MPDRSKPAGPSEPSRRRPSTLASEALARGKARQHRRFMVRRTVAIGGLAVSVALVAILVSLPSHPTLSPATGSSTTTTSVPGTTAPPTTVTTTTTPPPVSTTTTTTLPPAQLKWSEVQDVTGAQVATPRVACGSPTSCVFGDGDGNIYTYGGSGWTSQQVDPQRFGINPGMAFSCPSPSFCASVDNIGYALTTDGSGTWSSPAHIDSVGGDQEGNQLYLSCTSASYCLALDKTGYYFTYDGTNWSAAAQVVPSSSGSPGFMGVSCASATFCLALDTGGYYRFDGTSWSSLDVMQQPLSSVSCAASDYCLAVDSNQQLVVFDGTSWQPETTSSTATFAAVSCVLGGSCVAVGSDNGSGVTWLLDPSGQTTNLAGPWTTSDAITSLSCTLANGTFCMAMGSGTQAGPSSAWWATFLVPSNS